MWTSNRMACTRCMRDERHASRRLRCGGVRVMQHTPWLQAEPSAAVELGWLAKGGITPRGRRTYRRTARDGCEALARRRNDALVMQKLTERAVTNRCDTLGRTRNEASAAEVGRRVAAADASAAPGWRSATTAGRTVGNDGRQDGRESASVRASLRLHGSSAVLAVASCLGR
jgi:hypothetical protein